jgi:hypothetical protein
VQDFNKGQLNSGANSMMAEEDDVNAMMAGEDETYHYPFPQNWAGIWTEELHDSDGNLWIGGAALTNEGPIGEANIEYLVRECKNMGGYVESVFGLDFPFKRGVTVMLQHGDEFGGIAAYARIEGDGRVSDKLAEQIRKLNEQPLLDVPVNGR